MTREDLRQARTRFAKEIQRQGHIKSAGLIEGLATVPREHFVGPGPWKIMRAGAYQLTRGETEYSAKFTSPVGIFHCEGARSAGQEALLAKAFAEGNRASVCRLRRDAHGRGPNCWLHTSDVCLESDPA
jgi:hypothetical protein